MCDSIIAMEIDRKQYLLVGLIFHCKQIITKNEVSNFSIIIFVIKARRGYGKEREKRKLIIVVFRIFSLGGWKCMRLTKL